MSTAPDDLDAVKQIVVALTPFSPEEQERILRWSREKIGLALAPTTLAPAVAVAPTPPSATGTLPVRGMDIKSFVAQKQPNSDNQFAAVTAYYYAFEAADHERKQAINAEDLLEACRKAGRARPGNAGQTLRNAAFAGLLDKADRGAYKINSVGENLVAMTLPGGNTATATKKARKKTSPKSTLKKKPTSKKK